MRHLRIWAAMLLTVMVMAACADAPTTPQGEGISSAGNAGGRSRPNTDLMLDPVIVIGTPQEPTCDPYTDPNWCEGDDGGDQCMSSTDPGTSDPELVYVSSGCTGDPGSPGGGDPGTTEPPPPADTCQTGEAMVDDTDVHGQFDALWQQSLAEGVEMGGWIVRDGPNDYRLIPFQNAVYTPCGVDIFEAPPANLVSMFHTHPWRVGEARMCDGAYTLYTGTPSPEDVQALQQLGLSTGYFIDHTGIGKYTAAGGEYADRIDRCGY